MKNGITIKVRIDDKLNALIRSGKEVASALKMIEKSIDANNISEETASAFKNASESMSKFLNALKNLKYKTEASSKND